MGHFNNGLYSVSAYVNHNNKQTSSFWPISYLLVTLASINLDMQVAKHAHLRLCGQEAVNFFPWPNLSVCTKVRQMAQFHKPTNQCAQQSAWVIFSNSNVLFVLRQHTKRTWFFDPPTSPSINLPSGRNKVDVIVHRWWGWDSSKPQCFFPFSVHRVLMRRHSSFPPPSILIRRNDPT